MKITEVQYKEIEVSILIIFLVEKRWLAVIPCGIMSVKSRIHIHHERMIFADCSVNFPADFHEILQALFSSLTATTLKISPNFSDYSRS